MVAEEWESLKALREADGAERNMVADDIIGALGMEKETIEGAIDNRAIKGVVVVVMLHIYYVSIIQYFLTQTCRYVSPWCEDDGDTLGLGAGSPWAMLWAKAATHHGWLIFLANGAQWFKNVSYVGRYVGLV
jgi:hypothetical protein